MKDAIGTVVGVLVMVLMVVLCSGFIILQLDITKSQQYHSQVISNIEDSNYSDVVIEDILEEAHENGYSDLDIEVITTAEGDKSAKVTLDYTFTIPVINLDVGYNLVGYAR